MRGLKLKSESMEERNELSHLLQMRGLKQRLMKDDGSKNSRIFYRCVDWNIDFAEASEGWDVSHLLQMRGLKPFPILPTRRYNRRIFYRCVDWNNWLFGLRMIAPRRIFYRCVDWNTHLCGFNFGGGKVASFTDAWIETQPGFNRPGFGESHLLQMRGLKHLFQTQMYRLKESHLLQMRGLKHVVYYTLLDMFGRIFYRCVDWNCICPFPRSTY